MRCYCSVYRCVLCVCVSVYIISLVKTVLGKDRVTIKMQKGTWYHLTFFFRSLSFCCVCKSMRYKGITKCVGTLSLVVLRVWFSLSRSVYVCIYTYRLNISFFLSFLRWRGGNMFLWKIWWECKYSCCVLLCRLQLSLSLRVHYVSANHFYCAIVFFSFGVV